VLIFYKAEAAAESYSKLMTKAGFRGHFFTKQRLAMIYYEVSYDSEMTSPQSFLEMLNIN